MNSQDARHSVCVAGVITDDHGRALLIQRRDNHHRLDRAALPNSAFP